MKECRRHHGELAGVSVVVPHYGETEDILRLLRALEDQRTDRRVEVIAVDDCSPVPLPDGDGYTVVRRPVNGGFGAAVNSGAALAKEDLLLILNSDLVIAPEFLETLLSNATPHMPAVVSTRLIGMDGQEAFGGRHFPRVYHQAVEWLTPLARWRDKRWWHECVGHDTRSLDPGPRHVDWVTGALLLLPTASFLDVEGFDEHTFFMNCEEVDLQRRLRQRGLPAVHLGQLTVTHIGGGSSDSRHRRRWLVEARLRYAKKWGGLRRLRWTLTMCTALNLIWNTGRVALGRDVHPVATAREEWRLLWECHLDTRPRP